MNKYEVKIYYSTFCIYEIEAENEEDAIIKTRSMEIVENDIINNLENWEEADEVEEIT
jgi:hypothetical protein